MDVNIWYEPGDIAWMLSATALVLLMIPGVGFFYSGLARRKSALSLIWLSVMSAAVTTFQWFFWGFSLTFSHTAGPFIGDLANFGVPRCPGPALGWFRTSPRYALRRLPGHVLRPNCRSRYRCRRRAWPHAPLYYLHLRVGHCRVRPHRLLDLEPQWLVQQDGRPRFCWRYPCAHRFWKRCSGLFHDAGQA
uniref:Ammonium transporter AmtB-like domain-containing protein n=1 Tax=Fusarium oxysporum (strain Fo5176) TaxID=660025 RepID=A0A0D2X966_FUSOF